MDTQIDSTEIYGIRLLCFLEADPQSNKYNQILLNPEQFKKVSDAIAECFSIVSKDGRREVRDMVTSDESYPLPDLREIDHS